uniref:GIY-YIG endonuclease n=1 Tax=Juglanconis oblonga TaxID=1940568 RepID=A0A291LIW5_9PEZI|nr:GIY-YIG endonuclease [Juglanconis oblonga]
MCLKVAGKLPKFNKNVVHRSCSSKIVFSSSWLNQGDRLPRLFFAIPHGAGGPWAALKGLDPFNKKFFSTTIRLASERKSADFWHKVNSKNKVNEMNPHYLVERFLQIYSDRELAKLNINLDLINRIMSLHNPDFSLTLEDFNILKSIQPISLNYPFELSLPGVLGKPLRRGEGSAGVYLFTNKINGDRYVGSSINLATRLKNGYFGQLPIVGQRKIEVSIREHGLANFNLDVYLIPRDNQVGGSSFNEGSAGAKDKKTLQNLVLSLEQMLIMELNPELNEIKIAGSSPGTLTSKNLRNSYLYDAKNKELIYIVSGRKNLAKILGCNENALKRYLANKNKLYLNHFFVADDVLTGGEYNTKLISLAELEAYLNKIRMGRKNYLTKSVPSREETILKYCKQVELTNLVTKEVLIFGSLTKATEFINEYSPEFSNANKASISRNARTGVPYKGVFKLRYID